MKSSYFYCNIEYDGNMPEWLVALEKYSNAKYCRVYVLRFPVVDTKTEDYNENFIVMNPGHKIAIVNENNSNYDDYLEDVCSAISYLYQKYNYRPKLGLFTKIKERLINDNVSLDQLANSGIDKFFSSLYLKNELDRRYSELIISLCIGSINEIDRVGTDVPRTLLQKIKHKIQLFDGNQTRFIYNQNLEKTKIVTIQGLSGTGKTELLLHKLKELYINDNNYKIFFTCHNRILADTLHERIERFFDIMKVSKQLLWHSRLWCENAWGRYNDENSGLYRHICQAYNLTFRSFSYATPFETVCKNAVEELESREEVKPIFDYIIVDESQDFGGYFRKLCEKVTRYKVYMAGDIFQSIFTDDFHKEYKADYILGKCYRTAPSTLMFSQAIGLGLFENKRYKWLKDENWNACGYTIESIDDKVILKREPVRRFDGDDENYQSVELRKTSKELLPKEIINILNDIKKENDEYISPDDIAIIFIDGDNSIFSIATIIEDEMGNVMNWECNKAYETKSILPGFLTISNRNNTKGLEFPYIICITEELKDDYGYRNSLYTMMTRSFIKSYLLFTNMDYSIPNTIVSGLNEILNLHRMTIKRPSQSELDEIEMNFENARKVNTIYDYIVEFVNNNKLDRARIQKISQIMGLSGIKNITDKDLIMKKISQVNDLIDND